MSDTRRSIVEELRGCDPALLMFQQDETSSQEATLALILKAGRLDPDEEEALTTKAFRSEAFPRKPSRGRWISPVALALALALALAAIIAVVGIAISVTSGPGLKLRALPPKHDGTWRLTATLSGPQFQLATGNPNLIAGTTCASDSLCFLSTGYGLDYNGGGSLYVSRDGGRTWRFVTLPAQTAITSQVSSASSTWSAVGAGRLDSKLGDPLAKKPMHDPELLVTTNGGRTWSVRSVPLPLNAEYIPAGGGFAAETTYWPGSVDAVVCNAVKACQILGQAQIDGQGNSPALDRLFYLSTADSGRHWTSMQLPERASESSDQITLQAGTSVSMDCPSVRDCVAVASLDALPSSDFESWSSTDAGRTWVESPIPGASYLTAPLSCPSAGNCWLMAGAGSKALHTMDGGSRWTAISLPHGAWEGVSCSSSEHCWVSGSSIADTVNGGVDWTVQPVPAQVGTVPQISCSRQEVCVATAIPVDQGLTIENEGSLILTNVRGTPSQ